MPFFLNERVKTPYGDGKVIGFGSRNATQVIVEPLNWKLANEKPPTFYMNENDVKAVFAIGDTVQCTFGTGIVQSIRYTDGIYVVFLPNWILANSKPAIAYLNGQSISTATRISNVTTAVAKISGFDEIYSHSLALKEEAKQFYKNKEFNQAKLKYGEAINRLHSLDGDFTNEERARLYEMSLTCNSNLAICSWYSQNVQETIIFGRNTLLLLQAMEQKIGGENSEIWKELQKRNFDLQKLLDLRLKSLRMLVKAEMKKAEYEEAKKDAEAVLALEYSGKGREEMEALLADCNKRLAIQKKKEAQTWKKAFSGKVTIVDEEEERKLAQGSSSLPTSPKNKPTNNNDKRHKSTKSTNNSKKDEKADNFDNANSSLISTNNSYFVPLLCLGAVGVVGTVAYWMSRRR